VHDQHTEPLDDPLFEVPRLDVDAISWELRPTSPPPDVLALSYDEIVDAYRDLHVERDTYRLLACEALTAVHVLTEQRDALRVRVRTQHKTIAALMGVPRPPEV
jgi:hypothetical protein